jgi:PAS domain S-box-containing protein
VQKRELDALSTQVAALGGSVDDLVERIRVPAYLVDSGGRIRWLNAAARSLLGESLGRPFLDLVAADDRPRAQSAFDEKIMGQAASTELTVHVRTKDKKARRVEISSIPISDEHRVVGIFGIATPWRAGDDRRPGRSTHLTARQQQTLQLLGRGASTDEIAASLGVARETARNHIRMVLRELGTHSRLEAVVEAHRRGLL